MSHPDYIINNRDARSRNPDDREADGEHRVLQRAPWVQGSLLLQLREMPLLQKAALLL